MSTLCPFGDLLPSRPPYDDAKLGAGWRGPRWGLLGVELDDELLLDRRVDDLPLREGVHEDAHLRGDDLHPRRCGARTGELPRDDVGRQLADLLADLDDVVRADPVGRDVHLVAVDEHVPVADGLTGRIPGLGEPGAVDDVVQPRLEDAQQLVTGLAGAAVRLVVVAA